VRDNSFTAHETKTEQGRTSSTAILNANLEHLRIETSGHCSAFYIFVSNGDGSVEIFNESDQKSEDH
jgi:hypothetical protein